MSHERKRLEAGRSADLSFEPLANELNQSASFDVEQEYNCFSDSQMSVEMPDDLVSVNDTNSSAEWDPSDWQLRANEHENRALLLRQPGDFEPFSIRETAVIVYVAREGLVETPNGRPNWRTICKEPEAYNWFHTHL